MSALFPLDMLGEQASLLTAIVLGFGFGFALERAGFGSARKLAAQFYLYDMTVFKVMFTAILVAMVGYHAGVALGWVDPARMWINPTFLWAQLVGGFVLGLGFIVSGLCPGTAVVSLASGRLDALFALAGVFTGTFLFAVLVDANPAIERLYVGGSFGVSVLPALLALRGPWLALAVVLMAGVAFAGVEKLEQRFTHRPPTAATSRWAMIGVLAGLAFVSGFATPRPVTSASPVASPIAPLELAEALVAGVPDWLLLDLRSPGDPARPTLPAALPAADVAAVQAVLDALPPGAIVVVCAADTTAPALPATWPHALTYRSVRGGFAAWQREVLTARPLTDAGPQDNDMVLRQNALAAYFSGAKLETGFQAPPPTAVPAATARPKKKTGGC